MEQRYFVHAKSISLLHARFDISHTKAKFDGLIYSLLPTLSLIPSIFGVEK